MYIRNKYLLLIFIIAALLINVTMFITAVNSFQQDNARQDNVYMICDVYDAVLNGETVEIDIILPNGELLTQHMSINDDLPEGFNEVIIEAADLDDYSTYQIVGMR